MDNKRKCSSMKSQVDIMQHMRQTLPGFEYECIKDCICEFDNKKQNLRQLNSKAMSEALVYSKCCSAVFLELQGVLYQDYEFAVCLDALYSVSGIIEEEIGKLSGVRCTQHAQDLACVEAMESAKAAQDVDNVQDSLGVFEAGADSASPVYTRTATDTRSSREAHTMTWQQKIAQIKQYQTAELRFGKDDISQCNTHLRFALAYDRFDTVLELASTEYTYDASDDIFDTSRDVRGVENMLADGIKKSSAYNKLKNEVLLGAVIKFTQRLGRVCQHDKQSACLQGESITTLQQMRDAEEHLQRKLHDIIRDTGMQSSKQDKFDQAQCVVEQQKNILQNEVDRITKMVADIKTKIK